MGYPPHQPHPRSKILELILRRARVSVLTGINGRAAQINAALVLRDQFAQDSPAVRAFFDALVELLTGSGRKQ